MSDTTLSNVFWGHSAGVLVLSSSGLLWRSRATEGQKKLLKDDIVTLLWTPVGPKTHHLKVYQKGGTYVRFTGLKAHDVAQLKLHVERYFDRELEQEKVAASGGNWGMMKFEGPNLNFRATHASVMELPLEQISQCALPGKHEVELQFHEDDTVAGDEETLVEMRLYLPPSDGRDGDDDGVTAEDFRQQVLEKANIRSVMGKSIVDLDETIGTFLTPRGRYGVEIYGSFLRMHGKTFDYKIMYSNINRCFLLELPNGINTAFVISLEEPIRQGKQGYPHLVLQLSKNDVHIDVHLSSDEIKKYNGNIHERMSGALPQIVATLFKFIIGKKVYTSGKFKTHSGDRAVKCAVKAQSGVLFPLEKSFMFIHKPTTFIRYEEIDYIEFQRYAGQSGSSASRNFDLLVSCKSVGGEAAREYLFSAIDRREFPELSQFLTSKKLRIRNLKESHAAGAPAGSKKRDFNEYLEDLGPEEGEIEDEEDEEDSDFGPGDASGSESSDFSDEELSGKESDGEDGAAAKDGADLKQDTKKMKKKKLKKSKHKSSKDE
uniref:FACT complex subunit SSRP1 n=1 Tax=Peronospora matthiolae TaxID=2874970 RepID=A0AAV1TV95_9STRA